MEKKFLQLFIFICGFVPVLAGLGGAIQGQSFLQDTVSSYGVYFDSHFHYLSGLLLGIGFAFWSCIPRIETKEPRARVLTAIVFLGGLTRLWSFLIDGWPGIAMALALVMEMIVAPLLYLWLRRVIKAS